MADAHAAPQAIDWLEITDYKEALEIYRSPAVAVSRGSETDQRHFRGGTVIRLDGTAHRARRRVLSQLLKRDGHAWFREHALFPAVEANIREALADADAAGVARADLVRFSGRVNMQFAAGLVGFDNVRTPADAEQLRSVHRTIAHTATHSHLEVLYGSVDETELPAAVEAMDEFRRSYFDPAFDARLALLADVEAGHRTAEDLPRDALTLIAAQGDPAWADRDLALREAFVFVTAIVQTSTQALVFAVDDLARWFGAHPEDWARRTDEAFLLGALNESLRLHPALPGFIRVAADDLVLASGRRIRKGQHMVIRVGPANLDSDVFGAGARDFNPDRPKPPGHYPYGLAFGSGPHMCIGVPVVQGSEGIDGSLVHMLRALHAHDVRADPASKPAKEEHSIADHFAFYPVLLSV